MEWLTVANKYMLALQPRSPFYAALELLVNLEWNRRRQWHPTPVLLPGKSHGWRSLVGCSAWGRKESDMTEWLHFHFSLSFTGERNSNPLKCSCLENPRDRGARWAAVYRVTQSRTRLTWLSSSSSSKPHLLPTGLYCWPHIQDMYFALKKQITNKYSIHSNWK